MVEYYFLCRKEVMLTSWRFPLLYIESNYKIHRFIMYTELIFFTSCRPEHKWFIIFSTCSLDLWLFISFLISHFRFPVGIVANSCGPIDSDSSVKASHFIQLCSQRALPIIFIVNQTDQRPSEASGRFYIIYVMYSNYSITIKVIKIWKFRKFKMLFSYWKIIFTTP